MIELELKKVECHYSKLAKERIKRAHVLTRLEMLEKQFVEFTETHQKTLH